jgi:death-on-curing protein
VVSCRWWASWLGSSGGLNHEAHKGHERRIEGGEGNGDSVAPAGAGVLLDVNPQLTLWATVCRCSAPAADRHHRPGGDGVAVYPGPMASAPPASQEWVDLHNAVGTTNGLCGRYLLRAPCSPWLGVIPYGKPSLFELAASYAFGIVKNHPFIDGNKRTGFVVAIAFLQINGWHLEASEVDATLRTLALAAGAMTEAAYADWLKANCRRM